MQTRAIMQAKEAAVIELLNRGLSVRQISVQLRCSGGFVRRIRDEQQAKTADEIGSGFLHGELAGGR